MSNGEKKQGLKWFAFYVYARPILSLLFSLQFLSVFFENFYSIDIYHQIYGIGNIILLFATMIMFILALYKSKYLIKTIPIVLAYETFFAPLSTAINENYSNAESVGIYFVLLAALILFWFIPNFIYFRKRKWVFQDKKDIKVCKKCNNKVLRTEEKCPCCKTQLFLKNNKAKEIIKCGNCGSLVKESDKYCPNCLEVFSNEEKNKSNDNKEMFICDNCGEKVKESDTKCPNCGLKFVETSDEKQSKEEFVCDNCGATVNASAQKCPNCGAIFDEDIEESKQKKNNNSSSSMDKKYSDLNKLKKLLDKEIITKKEFEEEKKKILKD